MRTQQLSAAFRHRFETVRRAGATGAAVAIWLALASVGFAALMVHALTPGAALAVGAGWPSHSRLAFEPQCLNLLVFAHPRCPCLPATFEELSAIRAARPGRVLAVTVVFCKPAETPVGWERTQAWHTAEAMPGVRVVRDDDGAEAHLFGAATSGYALLYDDAGRLLCRGGITGARAHVGENAGRQAFLESASDLLTRTTPVFGCPLFTSCSSEDGPCPQ